MPWLSITAIAAAGVSKRKLMPQTPVRETIWAIGRTPAWV